MGIVGLASRSREESHLPSAESAVEKQDATLSSRNLATRQFLEQPRLKLSGLDVDMDSRKLKRKTSFLAV